MTVSGVTVNDGNGGNNYTVTYAANTTSTINKANLTVSTANVTKTYDGTTAAAGSATVTGGTQLCGSDSLSGGTFVFADKNAGTGKTVTVSGVTVNDGNSGNNYTMTYANNTTSTINKRDIAVTASGQNKTYDGTTAATVIYGDNRVASDALSVSGMAAFADKNAADGVGVSVSGISISGTDAGNYNLNNTTAATTANIDRAALTVTADSFSRLVGQVNPPLTYSYSGFAGGETAAVLTGGTTIGTAATTSSSVGSYAITISGNLTSPNYAVRYVDGVLTVRATTNSPYTGAVGGAFQLAGDGSGLGGGFGGGLAGDARGGSFGGVIGGSPGGVNLIGGGFGGLGSLLTISGSGINLGGLGQGGLNQKDTR